MSNLSVQETEKIYKSADCINYNYQWYHLFIAPKETLDLLCVSYDKTRMFIISLIRAIIALVITKIYYDEIGIDGGAFVVFSLLVIYDVYNLLILSYVVTKTQKHFKTD